LIISFPGVVEWSSQALPKQNALCSILLPFCAPIKLLEHAVQWFGNGPILGIAWIDMQSGCHLYSRDNFKLNRAATTQKENEFWMPFDRPLREYAHIKFAIAAKSHFPPG
jgi:hypothetical protein